MTTDYPVHNETGPPSPAGTIYPVLRNGMRLDLDIRISPITGRPVLHFPCQSISDIHWESMFSRAKRGCMVLRDIESDTLFVVGDMIGGIEMMKKATHHTPPFHRQGAAQLIEKAQAGYTNVIYPLGNHEVGAERYVKQPFRLFGIQVCDEADYTDPKGRRLLVEHGHKRRHAAMGFIDAEEGDKFGDTLLHMGGKLDLWLQGHGFEKASVSLAAKRIFKTTINKRLGVLALTETAIDDSAYDGSISGDTHMAGFHTTPGGKILINDGSWCDHVQYAVCDKRGNWACITHHRDRMEVEMEDGNKYDLHYADIGCAHFADEPKPAEPEHTAAADRLFRLAAFMWPAEDRKDIYKRSAENTRTIDRLFDIMDVHGADTPAWAQWNLYQAAMQNGQLKKTRQNKKNHGNLPPRAPRPEQALPFILPRPTTPAAQHDLAMAGD